MIGKSSGGFVTSQKYPFRFIILLYSIFCYNIFFLFDILLVLSDKNRGF